MEISVENEVENKYNHPFIPYEIQVKLMDAIYEAIENYKVGIFESPTGTGKTLSLICASMTWLRQYKLQYSNNYGISDKNHEDSSDDEPDWVNKAHKERKKKQFNEDAYRMELHLKELEKEYDSNFMLELDGGKKRYKKTTDDIKHSEKEFLPDDYDSDQDQEHKTQREKISREVKKLLERVENSESNNWSEPQSPIKIFFTSRTHSQLNQFAHQLGLTSFESSINGIDEKTKLSMLASRKQFCTNDKVLRLKNSSLINDGCLDLQKQENGCSFMPSGAEATSSELMQRFRDLSFTRIHDIEDLVRLGTQLGICPYYSSRKSLDWSEIITMPYNMLLSDSIRTSLKHSLENNIIIIDEAHNILDVISGIYSVSISLDDLNEVVNSINEYMKRFMRKLSSKNRINMMKLMKLIKTLLAFILNNKNSKSLKNGSDINIEHVFGDSTADLVNINKMDSFLSKSKIAFKIENYRAKKDEENTKVISASNPLLFKVTNFLKSFANPSGEGKFVWDLSNDQVSMSYILLDPSYIFKEIVDRARCVLLCGGTMEPMSDFSTYLFPHLREDQIMKFSCGHVVPKENLDVFALGNSRGISFEFQYDKRHNKAMIEELGNCIISIIKNIPFGVVIFFPSYKYLDEVFSLWKHIGIINQIECFKKVFSESSDPQNTNSLLQNYSIEIQQKRVGALLFAVVGGRLSEGINFSDDLARAVFMIGLPYPNIFSSDLIAKKNYIESNVLKKGGSKVAAENKSRDFYENICMRAVNQSIGRSIRHVSDYALIYLIDVRYGLPKVHNKLSGWIKEKIEGKHCSSPEEIIDSTKQFFKNKRKE